MKLLIKLFSPLALLIGKIQWKSTNELSEETKDKIREMLKKDYYVIVTRRNNHLSTYVISFAQFLFTGKFAYWSHALMNLEDEVTTDLDFRLLQATSVGVAYASFEDVFNLQSVALLKPKSMTIDEWTSVLDKARAQLGKSYDTLFDISNDKQLSCIELVRVILQAEPNYASDFKNFEALIAKQGNVTPQSLYDCKDFEVVFEVRG